MRKTVLVAWSALVLAVLVGQVAWREHALRTGTTLFVPLNAADTRPVRGERVQLRFAVPPRLESVAAERGQRTGLVVARVDPRGVATITKLYRKDSEILPGEHLLRYVMHGDQLVLGDDHLVVEAGTAERQSEARFAELRATDAGDVLLVGLRDSRLKPIDGEEGGR